MAQKLWSKNFEMTAEIERFTVGRDRDMDLYLAPYDVLGSMAHITMLETIGLLEKQELEQLLDALRDIYHQCERGEFRMASRTSTRRWSCCSRDAWAMWVRKSTPAARATTRCSST